MQRARAIRSGRIGGRPRANWLGDGQGWQMGHWGPFFPCRKETEERSVSRQTQGTSCFCTRRRTISEQVSLPQHHQRDAVQREGSVQTTPTLVLPVGQWAALSVCVSVCLCFVSLARVCLCLWLSFCVIHSNNGTNSQDMPPPASPTVRSVWLNKQRLRYQSCRCKMPVLPISFQPF